MNNPFPVRAVDRRRSQSVEPLGSKPKFWFIDGGRRMLFKAEDRGTGEDWAEVVSCHLCSLLGLPHVDYELASECDGENFIRPGVVCENMAPSPLVLILGNQLLLVIDLNYPQKQRFKVRQHSVGAVCEVLSHIAVPEQRWLRHSPAGISSALGFFVGYVMLDAWIANQDRHHENWGALWTVDALRLAPTFDHGAALARNLTDKERNERLATKDHQRSISSFAAKGRSAFYDSPEDLRPMELRDAFRKFATHDSSSAGIWLSRLASVKDGDISAILDRVPSNRMSDICKAFTLELLMTNQRRLLE